MVSKGLWWNSKILSKSAQSRIENILEHLGSVLLFFNKSPLIFLSMTFFYAGLMYALTGLLVCLFFFSFFCAGFLLFKLFPALIVMQDVDDFDFTSLILWCPF